MGKSREELAYIAGLFDGEGCITFCKVRTSIYPQVTITNTDLDLLENLKEMYGGNIQRLSKREDNWKQGYYWRLSWTRAVDFLSSIQPWLQIKDRQAQAVFAWNAIRLGQGKVTNNIKQEYAESVGLLVEYMHWLNKKGPALEINPLEKYLNAVEEQEAA